MSYLVFHNAFGANMELVAIMLPHTQAKDERFEVLRVMEGECWNTHPRVHCLCDEIRETILGDFIYDSAHRDWYEVTLDGMEKRELDDLIEVTLIDPECVDIRTTLHTMNVLKSKALINIIDQGLGDSLSSGDILTKLEERYVAMD